MTRDRRDDADMTRETLHATVSGLLTAAALLAETGIGMILAAQPNPNRTLLYADALIMTITACAGGLWTIGMTIAIAANANLHDLTRLAARLGARGGAKDTTNATRTKGRNTTWHGSSKRPR